ncbi:hypothetical protein [Engelhardtia mirabilis]|uniref:Uncharacterized protein n=1 Tax=Engelhardtia mirabilis TaxID=2528011 RepID=A0A518BPC6_9BACT|nr:hypothetical protein Pla133_38860 [Planctomycetes bacterium Pla133]QDV03110.1 hypothetical protein Pla86_38850 [Planctomycetes bacterium Pla86]
MLRFRVAVVAGPLLLVCGCDRSGQEPRSLRVELFRQAGQSGVFLNEVLTVHLSAPLDPASVNRSSARVVDDRGRPVTGRFEVDAERLRFHPRPPLEPELSDGSFEPGQRYRIELAGFPRPDGIRGRSGEPLAATWWAEFVTAAPGGAQPLFEDPSLWRAEPLTIASTEVEATAPIELRCAEPLDPRTVRGESFQLVRYESAETSAEGEGAASSPGGTEQSRPPAGSLRLTRIPLRAELIANDAEGARIALVPLGPSGVRRGLVPGEHHLGLDPLQPPPTDLGGNPAAVIWAAVPGGLAPLTVVGPQRESRAHDRTFDFLSAGMRSPEEPSGVDGTAWWDDGGLVTLRLPAACGSGADGPVLLTSGPVPRSISATSLGLSAGALCELPDSGPVILRAQGRVELDGRLDRRLAGPALSWTGDLPHEDWVERVVDEGGVAAFDTVDFGAGETLSEWLEHLGRTAQPVTVIIAGGDLVIDGDICVDGPLVLVAGGWLRVHGRVSAPEVWKSDLGDGARLSRRPRLLPLDIDPPTADTLREAQSWTVLSAPFSPREESVRWTGARVASDPGLGWARVRYLGERTLPSGEIERIGPVDDPLLLEESPAVRLLIELGMGPARPGQPWLPPRVDSVELTWVTGADRP